MSNQVIIQRRRVTAIRSKISWNEAHIFDDYGSLGSVTMSPLPKNDYVLFVRLLQLQRLDRGKNIDTILQYMDDVKTGVTIDGTYLDYECIKGALSHYVKENNNE